MVLLINIKIEVARAWNWSKDFVQEKIVFNGLKVQRMVSDWIYLKISPWSDYCIFLSVLSKIFSEFDD